MGKEILKVYPNYTIIPDFTPQSAGSDIYKEVYYTDGKKSVILYDFMDMISDTEGTTYTGTDIPFIRGSNVLKTDNIMELPPFLLYWFTMYKDNVIYYPLTSDLRSYSAPLDGQTIDLSVFNNRDKLKNLRIMPTPYNDASSYTLEVPGFYDGIASYYNDNKFKYTCSDSSAITKKDTEFFFSEDIYTSNNDTTLELTVSLLDSSIEFDVYKDYCLSFYIRKNTESSSVGELTVAYVANGENVAVDTYVDSLGKHTDKATYSNMWERLSCTFSSDALDINESNIVLKISIPSDTSLGGFLLEENKVGEGSLCLKTMLNEPTVKHHIPSIWLKTYSTESYSYETKDLTDKDWTIAYTKIGGITLSKEVIGDVIISEGLDSDNTRYFSITEGSSTVKRKILDLESASVVDYSKRTYYLSYIKDTKTLDIYIIQNGEMLKLVDDTDTENHSFEIDPSSFSYKVFSRDNPLNSSATIYQHILLGGESREVLYPSTRYCDLIYVDNKALSIEDIKEYSKSMMLIKNIPFTAEYTNVITYDDGTTTTKQAEEDISKAANILTSFLVMKDVATTLNNNIGD